MSPNFCQSFDGSGRVPRKVQVDVLKNLEDNWDKYPNHIMSLATGLGKSYLMLSIAKCFPNAAIITPSNILVQQYISEYPNINYLWGKQHYQCHKFKGFSCADIQDDKTLGDSIRCAGDECEYKIRKAVAMEKTTIYNPMSFLFLMKRTEAERKDVILIDEAHLLPDMLLTITRKVLKKSKYNYPDDVSNAFVLRNFIETTIVQLDALMNTYSKRSKMVGEIFNEICDLRLLIDILKLEPHNFITYTEKCLSRGRPDEQLIIQPLKIPKALMQYFLDANHVVMMSGSILSHDIKEMLGDRKYKYYDYPSPIPKENRQVFFMPTDYKMNFETPPEKIAESIDSIYNKDPVQNTIVHVTYDLSKKISPLMKTKHLINDKLDKEKKLKQFKEEGGLFLASGCAEGIDLKDDFARRNVIVKLQWPNRGDEFVKKRMSLIDGESWYALQMFKTTIQQAGRTTRNEKDYSEIYILDKNFVTSFKKYHKELPAYFKESIIWSNI